MKKHWPLVAAFWLPAVLGACSDSGPQDGLVARAGDYELTVEDVAELMVDEEQLPADRGVVERLASLWVDYTVLAAAAARDSTFSSIDFEPLVRRQLEQAMIFQLRDSVIQVDTVISDAELRSFYEGDDPPMELRARHILLGVPPGAADTDRQAIRERLGEIRAQIMGGASFEEMATRFSQDPGTSRSGGDLGFFGRGDMFPEFEAAVLALEPGEVSDIVQTQIGFHLIKLEQKRPQGFEEIAPGLRERLRTQRYLQAESVFVATVEERAGIEPVDGSVAIVRELARDPGTRLTGRAGDREIYRYDGGALTVGEALGVLQSQTPGFRAQVVAGDDEELQRLLQGLVQRELLAAEAEQAGFAPTDERVDSLVLDARAQLRAAARSLGLLNPDRAPGEAQESAIGRSVLEALERVLTGGANVVELGVVGFQLRDRWASAVYPQGVGEAVLLVGQRRANRSASILENSVDTSQASDTTGN